MTKLILQRAMLMVPIMMAAFMVQGAAQDSPFAGIMDLTFKNIFLVMSILVIIGIGFTLAKLASAMFELQKLRMMKEMGIEMKPVKSRVNEKSTFEKVYSWLWSIVPITKEREIDLGHDYDGIRELDNRLPPWWLLLFYGSILWGVGYMFYYHWSGRDWSSQGQYIQEMEVAEVDRLRYMDRMTDAINENNVTMLTDERSLAFGEEIYKMNCLVCHGVYGEGTVGPNFTDEYWVHGGGIKNVFRIVKNGVPAKGMISWKSQLRPIEMQQVASYILTLEGTDPPNQKEPEGTKWTPEEDDLSIVN